MKSLIISICLLFFSYGCSKDEDTPSIPQDQASVIDKIWSYREPWNQAKGNNFAQKGILEKAKKDITVNFKEKTVTGWIARLESIEEGYADGETTAFVRSHYGGVDFRIHVPKENQHSKMADLRPRIWFLFSGKARYGISYDRHLEEPIILIKNGSVSMLD